MFEELKITNDKQDADINPLVLMTFINVEHGSNRDIINYVKIRYENHVGKVGKKTWSRYNVFKMVADFIIGTYK